MIQSLAAALGRKVDAQALGVYWGVMRQYSLADVRAGIEFAARSEEDKMPTPARLVRYVQDCNAPKRLESDTRDMGRDMTPGEKQRAYWARIFYINHWRAFNELHKNTETKDRPQYVQPSRLEFDEFVKARWNSPEYTNWLAGAAATIRNIVGGIGRPMPEDPVTHG